MPVPVALAEMNSSLRTGQKSVIADLITSGINFPSKMELQGSSCLPTDGLALVSAIGKDHLVPKRLGTLQIAVKQHFFTLDSAIIKFTSYLIVIRNIPSNYEREKDPQSPRALSDVLFKMAVSPKGMDLSGLKATHEEAQTRLILCRVNSSLDNIVVLARDTDVLSLLIAHAPRIPNLYMKSGTAAKRKCFNIRAIFENLPTDFTHFFPHYKRGS